MDSTVTVNVSDNVFYSYEVVTDPDDPAVQDSLDRLLDMAEKDQNVILVEDHLDRGLVKYSITTNQYNSDIISLIGKVGYDPVTITFDLKVYNGHPDIGSIITGLSTIVKEITQYNLQMNIKNVETMERDNMVYVFTPITTDNTSVYGNSEYLDHYYQMFDPEFLMGYQVLSNDVLTDYVLTILYNNGDYNPERLKIRQVDRLYLLPVGNDYNDIKFFSEVRDRVQNIIDTRRREGYFTYDIGIHSLSDMALVEELASLWDTEILYEEDPSSIVMHTKADLGNEPYYWFHKNVDIVRNGDFPSITLYGDWQIFMGSDYDQIYDNSKYTAILQYKALLAYRRLGLEDPFIQPFTHTVRCNPDYSITLSIPTYDHVVKFREYFLNEMEGYLGIDNQRKKPIVAEYCEDLIDGVVKRYYVQSVDNKAFPMVLLDNNGRNLLVFTSPLINNYEDYKFNFDKLDMDKIRQDLTNDLKSYYSVCHQKMEPVTLDQVDEMELIQLLDLVEIQERPNQPTYCYTKQTLLSLDRPVNPLTRRPLSDQVLIKAMLMEWGLRGLFGVGNLIGLYPDMPHKILVPPISGVPLITQVSTDPLLRDVLGNVYEVEVGFDDGYVSGMFEIATSDQSKLSELVNDLWNRGYFLTYWASSLQKYNKELPSFEVLINKPLLIQAANSKDAGERAMNYLEEASYHTS